MNHRFAALVFSVAFGVSCYADNEEGFFSNIVQVIAIIEAVELQNYEKLARYKLASITLNETLLLAHVRNGDTRMADLIMRYESHKYAKGLLGENIIFHVVRPRFSPKYMEHFLQAGVQLTTCNFGMTPLHFLVLQMSNYRALGKQKNLLEKVALLKKYNVDVSAESKEGSTLHGLLDDEEVYCKKTGKLTDVIVTFRDLLDKSDA